MGFRLIPRDDTLYEMFTHAARLLAEGAREMTGVLGATPEERIAIADRIHAIEHSADEAKHELIRRVGGSFLTPFDRGDLYRLATQLDACLDHIDVAVDLIVLYRLDGLPQGVADQVEALTRMAGLTADSMPRLRSPGDLADYCIEINRLENQADEVYRRLRAELYDNEQTNAVHILKLKDVVDELESAANAFEDLANCLESLALQGS